MRDAMSHFKMIRTSEDERLDENQRFMKTGWKTEQGWTFFPVIRGQIMWRALYAGKQLIDNLFLKISISTCQAVSLFLAILHVFGNIFPETSFLNDWQYIYI